MTDSRFQPAPRVIGRTDGRKAQCAVPGHGQFDDDRVEQFDGSWLTLGCPQCRWLALHNAQAGSPERQQAEAEQAARRLNERLLATGITLRFRGCSFENFRTEGDAAKLRAWTTCRSYAENFAMHYAEGRALMLLGEIGNGKTHLACAILQHLVRHEGASGLIVTAEAITQAVVDSFRNTGPTKTEVLAELAAPDLLVIDEVGLHSQRPGKDFTPSLLHEVIDRRYQLVLPTVVISNQPREALPAFIGPRAADRLRENGGLLAPFTWASARVGGAA